MGDRVNPEMIVLAREARGLNQSQLVKESQINTAYISQYESGQRETPAHDLEIIADVLRFPISFFYQGGESFASESGEYFHRKRVSLPIRTLNRLHAQLNIFRMNTQILLKDVPVNHKYEVPRYDVRSFGGDIEAIAEAVRAAWRMNPKSVKNLTARLEDAFIFIQMINFETDQMDETCQWCEPMRPVFLMNSRVSGERARFSLAHALGHLVMHHDVAPYEEMEDEANRFAAAFLMPADQIRAELSPVTIEHLLQMKPDWRVSIQALIHRARDVGVINETRYKSLFQMLSRAGYRRNEPFPIPHDPPTLIGKLIKYHQTTNRRSIAHLADLTHLHEHDFRNWYVPEAPGIRLLSSPTSTGEDDMPKNYL